MKRWFCRLEFKFQDMWVGLYWERKSHTFDAWLCVVPMFPLHFGYKAADTPAPRK